MTTEDRRKQHNLELIRRYRAGDSLTSYSTDLSYFPPRPVIKKDPNAIRILYSQPETRNSLRVVYDKETDK